MSTDPPTRRRRRPPDDPQQSPMIYVPEAKRFRPLFSSSPPAFHIPHISGHSFRASRPSEIPADLHPRPLKRTWPSDLVPGGKRLRLGSATFSPPPLSSPLSDRQVQPSTCTTLAFYVPQPTWLSAPAASLAAAGSWLQQTSGGIHAANAALVPGSPDYWSRIGAAQSAGVQPGGTAAAAMYERYPPEVRVRDWGNWLRLRQQRLGATAEEEEEEEQENGESEKVLEAMGD